MIKFEWHPSKAAANLKKHQVSFEEAQTVFTMTSRFSSSMTSIRTKKTAFYRGTEYES